MSVPCTPSPNAKPKPTDICLNQIRAVLAGQRNYPPNLVRALPRHLSLGVQPVVNDACDIDLRPADDPLKHGRNGAEIGNELSRDGNLIGRAVTGPVLDFDYNAAEQSSPAIATAFRSQRNALDTRVRHWSPPAGPHVAQVYRRWPYVTATCGRWSGVSEALAESFSP